MAKSSFIQSVSWTERQGSSAELVPSLHPGPVAQLELSAILVNTQLECSLLY